jgi:hypothetical protein
MCNLKSEVIKQKNLTMNRKSTIIATLICFFIVEQSFAQPIHHERYPYRTRTIPYQPVRHQSPYNKPKIQAAIILDVSNSMDGLIEQAKMQLWNMVTTMGKATCNEIRPQIEIALYEYGRTNNNPRKGYIKQLSGFTSNLDLLSSILFNLKTDGGDEFAPQAIYSSLVELNWDENPNSYKTIFISGNESFLQGPDYVKRACLLAKQKGVMINAIFCGDRMEGVRLNWRVMQECGGGSYSNINQNERPVEFETPYDDELMTLNEELNSTYVYYGNAGRNRAFAQKEMDGKNKSMSKSAYVKRIEAKSNKAIYNNEEWDLVDKMESNPSIIQGIDKNQLADSLKGKSNAEIEKVIKKSAEKRKEIQRKIADKTAKRNAFVSAEKRKLANKNSSTLETEVEKTIREQAAKKGMKME